MEEEVAVSGEEGEGLVVVVVVDWRRRWWGGVVDE